MTVSRIRTVTAAVAVASGLLVSGCSGTGSGDSGESTTQAAPMAESDLQDAYQQVIGDVLPSVVQIDASDSLGSGVVYDDKGHVVTNAHVVGKEETFKVTTATGEQALTAKLVAAYPEQDLAVIKLDNPPSKLEPAKFADSTKAKVGQIVLAMGSPLGLSSSVTQGIISATGRTVSEPRTEGAAGATIANMVQTSAAINPGNSGGALVTLDSEVIGIPTLAATDPQMGDSAAPGIGFAIPSSMVKTIADQIIKDGKVTDSGRAALGITGRTVLGDDYKPAGVAVVDAQKDGGAAKAGLQGGDIITKLGGSEITTITSLSEALAGEKPGDKAQVTYVRDGSEKTADVTLGEM
ncbi:trypsin-like peptidase domain-containing protein [Streptomyces sp. NPDC051214]|uniref:S1C family serine protease n=1 Tax=Streptomyces sp. NPDC051214 TaxID=3155282 RepID=UPI003444E0F3